MTATDAAIANAARDRKDAANCADLLEQGRALFCSQPDGPLAELRRLVKCLRRARAELAA